MYGTGSVSVDTFKTARELLQVAKPKLSDDWFNVLYIQLGVCGFTDERLIGAVNELIRTNRYPEPSLAEILEWDSTVEFLDYPAYCAKCSQGMGQFYKLVRKQENGRPALWAHVDDVEKYKIPVVTPGSRATGTKSEPPSDKTKSKEVPF